MHTDIKYKTCDFGYQNYTFWALICFFAQQYSLFGSKDIKKSLPFYTDFGKQRNFFLAGKLIVRLWSDAKSKQIKIQNSATTSLKKIFQYFFIPFFVSIFVLNAFEIGYITPTSFLFSPLLMHNSQSSNSARVTSDSWFFVTYNDKSTMIRYQKKEIVGKAKKISRRMDSPERRLQLQNRRKKMGKNGNKRGEFRANVNKTNR